MELFQSIHPRCIWSPHELLLSSGDQVAAWKPCKVNGGVSGGGCPSIHVLLLSSAPVWNANLKPQTMWGPSAEDGRRSSLGLALSQSAGDSASPYSLLCRIWILFHNDFYSQSSKNKTNPFKFMFVYFSPGNVSLWYMVTREQHYSHDKCWVASLSHCLKILTLKG